MSERGVRCQAWYSPLWGGYIHCFARGRFVFSSPYGALRLCGTHRLAFRRHGVLIKQPNENRLRRWRVDQTGAVWTPEALR